MQHKFTEKEKIILQAISLVIKERLSVLNKSQRLLGYENGVQPSFISRMKLNQNEPKIFSIWELSNALEMKPSEFFKLVEDKLLKILRFLIYNISLKQRFSTTV